MTRQHASVALTVAIATFAAFIRPPTAHAASLPNPPHNLCIEDSSGCAPAVAVSSDGVKWHPGHYALIQGTNMPSASLVNALASEPNVIGVVHMFTWAALEPTRGNYDFSQIDTMLAMCRAAGKRLIMDVQPIVLSGGSTVGKLPQYLATEPNGEGGWYLTASGAGAAKRWVPAIMDREIALMQAIAARYDNEPYLEAYLHLEGSSLGISPGDPAAPTYTRQALATQLKRLAAAEGVAWRHTITASGLDYLSGEMDALVESVVASRVGIASPDIMPGSPTRAQRVWVGDTEAGTGGGIDYRGKAPALFQVQTPELGGKEGNFTPQQLYDEAVRIGTTHMAWVMKGSSATTTDWPNEILPFLRAGGHPLATACPTQYKSCNTN